jgi:guanosine-diphosphatase
MIDAGSTGSRIHIYRFNYCHGPSPTLEDEVFHQIKPGLSHYKHDVFDAALSIRQLMDVAVKNVPIELHACTPLALKATAGLRLLGEEQSKNILHAVEEMIREKYKFKLFPTNGVAVMDGSDEGVFAWVTVNYLLKRIGLDDKVPTVGIMDLGGASTQIVFEPKGNSILDPNVKEFAYKVEFGKHMYNLYQHSYLGYGLMKSREKIKLMAARSHSKESPCIYHGMSEEFDTEETNSVYLKGSMKTKDDCREFVRKRVFHTTKEHNCTYTSCSFDGIYQPSLTESFSDPRSDLYAFSYFYDRTEPFNINSPLKISELGDLVDKACTKDVSKEVLKENPDFCLDLSYIYGLVKYGYEMEDVRSLYIEKKINGFETGWCLGASIHMLDYFAKNGDLCKNTSK